MNKNEKGYYEMDPLEKFFFEELKRDPEAKKSHELFAAALVARLEKEKSEK